MSYLILSILCSTGIALLFKVFAQRGFSIFQCIVANYWTAVLCGLILQGSIFSPEFIPSLMDKSWLWISLTLGVLFISGFYAMGMTVKHFGVSMSMLCSKMSIIISVTAAIILYSESITFLKVLGILLTLISIYLVSRRDEVKSASIKLLFIPIYLWLASGIIEVLLNLAEERYSIGADINLFNASIFGTAGVIGTVIFLGSLLKNGSKFSPSSWLSGIILGIVNYASIYYALKALELPQYPASVFYPINNVAIICLSVLAAWYLLSEHISKTNLVGIGLAIIGIVCISFS